ncbi:tRNA1(Val) (adenine(37)-N6)-methyltransferase [Cecembia rubra]|uniref:tRNA1(Val) (adenine(37)-N6)-methyltransferase n=1 Tax=Cecembia rubra TaxID=1485585 RepID=UPI0027146ECF|nr:methyltransferase [Cecembia rubra]
MSKSYFQFKQFGIKQDHCAMKVGTDGVLLGALAGNEKAKNMLEIGVGTGVVSLMIAQRFGSMKITGVELDQDAYNQALENARNSPWWNRISFYHQDFQSFSKEVSEKFDLIVSNPPYFPNHLKSADTKRNLALHNDSLSFDDLLDGVESLLLEKGKFWVILPSKEMRLLERKALSKNLHAEWQLLVKDRESKPAIREIQVFSFEMVEKSTESLVMKNENGEYTLAYSGLLKEFLLIF